MDNGLCQLLLLMKFLGQKYRFFGELSHVCVEI